MRCVLRCDIERPGTVGLARFARSAASRRCFAHERRL